MTLFLIGILLLILLACIGNYKSRDDPDMKKSYRELIAEKEIRKKNRR